MIHNLHDMGSYDIFTLHHRLFSLEHNRLIDKLGFVCGLF